MKDNVNDALRAQINTTVMSEEDYLRRIQEKLGELQQIGRGSAEAAQQALIVVGGVQKEISHRIELVRSVNPYGWVPEYEPGIPNEPTKAEWKHRALHWAQRTTVLERRLQEFQKKVADAAGAIFTAAGISSWMADE